MTYFQHSDFSKCHFSHFVIFLGFEKSFNGYKLPALAMLTFHHHTITSLSYDFYHLIFIHPDSRLKIPLNFISIFFFIISFLDGTQPFSIKFQRFKIYSTYYLAICMYLLTSYGSLLTIYRMFLKKLFDIFRYRLRQQIVSSI